LADAATIPLHLYAAKADVEMNNSVSDLIGMIDSGVAPIQDKAGKQKPKQEPILQMRSDKPAPKEVVSQRGIRKRPFEQAQPQFDDDSREHSPRNTKRKKVEDESKAKPDKKKPKKFV
jgi:hypothetical protein